jgi:hypothetical protein
VDEWTIAELENPELPEVKLPTTGRPVNVHDASDIVTAGIE